MNKRLTLKQRFLVAGTLFGMFFGAGNLIFPVHLVQLAGYNAVPAILGFVITAVSIPILGVAAIGITHSDGLQTLANKVGKGYGYLLTWVDVLCYDAKRDTALRVKPDIKSEIIDDITKDEKLYYVDANGEEGRKFVKVMTEDGLFGFVKKSDLYFGKITGKFLDGS